MRFLPSAACVAAVLLTCGAVAAQDGTAIPSVGVELLTGRIQDVAADREGTGTRAWGGQVTGGLTLYRIVNLGAEFGIVDMADEAPFSQPTDHGDMSSSVSAFLGTFTAGLRSPRLALGETQPVTASAGLNVGHTWLSTRRMITNCSDCDSEDVDIHAGSFVEPAVQLNRGRGGLTARYRIYSGDSNWENALMIGYSWTVSPRSKTREETAPGR
jgi:hypothetical protein